MATYAVGDIQGCLAPLHRLLDQIQFNPATDRLWCVGDLVNRGPHSLETLRFLKNLDCVVVLGNHDLHLLAVHSGVAQLRTKDTLQSVLEAPDATELLDWLRRQRLLYRAGGYVLVHAGILPQWSIEQAVGLAQEVERVLRSDRYDDLLPFIYRSEETRWNDALPSPARLGLITNVFTRMRMCSEDGTLDLSFKGPPELAPAGLSPWFHVPPRTKRKETVIFGHWSALGLREGDGFLALDAGCVWGKELGCIRLEDGTRYTVSCRD